MLAADDADADVEWLANTLIVPALLALLGIAVVAWMTVWFFAGLRVAWLLT